MRIRTALLSSIAACCLILAAASGELKYALVKPDVLMRRLSNAPKKNTERAAQLERMFRQVGYEPSQETVKGIREPNVLCTLRGSSDSLILVAGHLDHVEEGDGIVDDWSGASMLPSLYQSLAVQPRAHTFLFVGFSGEEQGLVGSDFYVKNLLPEQRKQIAAMVNLECLGLTPTKVWVSHSDPTLVGMLIAMAQSAKLPLSGVNVENVGTDDAQSFTHYKIPHITIHSLTAETLPILHSDKDRLNALHEDLYYDSYRLVVPYLALLDERLPTDRSPIGK